MYKTKSYLYVIYLDPWGHKYWTYCCRNTNMANTNKCIRIKLPLKVVPLISIPPFNLVVKFRMRPLNRHEF